MIHYSILIGLGVLLAVVLGYVCGMRPWHMRWGTRGDEAVRTLPGDNLIAQARDQYTRAVSIQAPPERLWQWLVQIGQGRGGLYSYEALENLIGCDIHNLDEIRADLQILNPGDKVRLGPEGYPYYNVAEIVAPSHILLKSPGMAGELHTWLFLIEPQEAGNSRLIVRSRGVYPPTLGQTFIWRIMTEPLHFMMERKMLMTLKHLAERA